MTKKSKFTILYQHRYKLVAYRNFEISFKKKNTIEIFLNLGPYGNEIFKTLLLQL